MTLLELCKLLRVHIKALVVVALVAAIACGAGCVLKTSISPVYAAKASVVITGGAFNAATGLAANEAIADVSVEGVSVESSANTSQNTITFTAKASTDSLAINAANQAASSLADLASNKAGATSTTITSAKAASLTGKSPFLYAGVGFFGGLFCVIAYFVIRDSMRGGVHSPQAVAESGLTFLGELQNDEARMRIILANFQFSGNTNQTGSPDILLHPTNKKVHLQEACDMLASAAKEAKVALHTSLPLQESVDTLYKGRDVHAVVVVVEENTSTLAEIEEIVREFALANIHAGGFVYMPYTKHKA